MRNSTYNNATTPGIMTNTMSLWGPDIPFDSAQFDMATSVQNSIVNAGKYTFTEGGDPGGVNGTYNYTDGNYNLTGQNWAPYFDPLQNNPWAYPGNKP